ncbi:MAG: hypothetical protein KAT77_05910 [Nanoarchaeota archaeon]|nr:hypothetical protein [Nanoarchaeota archaeon]
MTNVLFSPGRSSLVKGVVTGMVVVGAIYTTAVIGALWYGRKVEKENYPDNNKPILGVVLKENYQNPYSDAENKLDSKYTIKVKREDNGQIIAVSIVDAKTKTKESLDMLIDDAETVGLEKATRISFPTGNRGYEGQETYFKAESQTGTKRADRVTVLSR